jgi:ribosomal protein L29
MSKELKTKSDKELEKMLKETREELRKFRFSQVGSSTRNIKEGQNLRKKIAQILTEVNSR